MNAFDLRPNAGNYYSLAQDAMKDNHLARTIANHENIPSDFDPARQYLHRHQHHCCSAVSADTAKLFNAGATSPAPASAPRNKPCTAAAHRQFDFWIGDWDVTDPSGKSVGTNRIKPILGGCIIRESWVATGGTFTRQSYNTFDASRDVWHQTWVDMNGTLLLEGQIENGVMVLIDKHVAGKKDPNAWNEISWTPHADESVTQRWRTSADGGKTWKTAFDGKYVIPFFIH